jgi:hypothetical protein
MVRFTIRDVLWLTVVAALGVAWWSDHRQLARDQVKFKVADRMLHQLVDQYYADTGRYMALQEDITGLDYRPTRGSD